MDEYSKTLKFKHSSTKSIRMDQANLTMESLPRYSLSKEAVITPMSTQYGS